MGRAGGGRRLTIVHGEAVHTISEVTVPTKEDLGLVNVRIRWSQLGSRAECSQWWEPLEGDSQENVTPNALLLFAGYAAARLDQDWVAHRPPPSLLVEAVATKYRQGVAPVQSVATINSPGTSPTDTSLPDQCSLVISFRTLFAGRSYRGRNYLPYIANHSNTLVFGDGEVRMREDVCAALANQYPMNLPMDSGVVNRAYGLVVWSPTTGGAEPVSHCVVDTNIDTQRRRSN